MTWREIVNDVYTLEMCVRYVPSDDRWEVSHYYGCGKASRTVSGAVLSLHEYLISMHTHKYQE